MQASAAPAVSVAPARRRPSSDSLPVVPLSPPAIESAAPASVAQFDELELAPTTALQRQSELREEAALLRQARQRLRALDLASAAQLLDASRSRFAAPQLRQEREALAIELLFRSGQKAAAAERTRAFLQAFPNSPHAGLVRSFAGDLEAAPGDVP